MKQNTIRKNGSRKDYPKNCSTFTKFFYCIFNEIRLFVSFVAGPVMAEWADETKDNYPLSFDITRLFFLDCRHLSSSHCITAPALKKIHELLFLKQN